MKKLTMMAVVAALAIPATVQAAEQIDPKWYEGETTINFTTLDGEMYDAPFIPAEGETLTLDLVNGGQIMLDGEAAYLIDQNGNKFLANDAPHMTTAGVAYQTQDGIALYAIPEAKTYTFTADVQDEDGDGVADDVDMSIQ